MNCFLLSFFHPLFGEMATSIIWPNLHTSIILVATVHASFMLIWWLVKWSSIIISFKIFILMTFLSIFIVLHTNKRNVLTANPKKHVLHLKKNKTNILPFEKWYLFAYWDYIPQQNILFCIYLSLQIFFEFFMSNRCSLNLII